MRLLLFSISGRVAELNRRAIVANNWYLVWRSVSSKGCRQLNPINCIANKGTLHNVSDNSASQGKGNYETGRGLDGSVIIITPPIWFPLLGHNAPQSIPMIRFSAALGSDRAWGAHKITFFIVSIVRGSVSTSGRQGDDLVEIICFSTLGEQHICLLGGREVVAIPRNKICTHGAAPQIIQLIGSWIEKYYITYDRRQHTRDYNILLKVVAIILVKWT